MTILSQLNLHDLLGVATIVVTINGGAIYMIWRQIIKAQTKEGCTLVSDKFAAAISSLKELLETKLTAHSKMAEQHKQHIDKRLDKLERVIRNGGN